MTTENHDLEPDSMEDLIRKPKAKKPKAVVKNRISEILRSKNMTQAELSDLSEMYPAHLSEIINHTRKGITLPIALKISGALQMPVEEIFYLPTQE
jgi:transcriptional regulator with XRE-family HTH domain